MKKKMSNHQTFDNSEAKERWYQQKFKIDQRILQSFLNSFSQCFCVPFYLYDYSVFLQNDSYINEPEDNENKSV
ncbi:hypothetical protein QA584_19780 [Anaerocolumna sp. AGMB13025]|uniref:hypothetical protein n=1 Tax=Anaerocolumna sp. AGMB13025 TaxID=3039116 RepID=UPI00241F58D2|nr:hypothetical protein [Anaerocolumna sp. AGMB13025]WFR55841.1 hypothetical protein QA584_19780 [Anaerocolumna sp. AGMB13025]